MATDYVSRNQNVKVKVKFRSIAGSRPSLFMIDTEVFDVDRYWDIFVAESLPSSMYLAAILGSCLQYAKDG